MTTKRRKESEGEEGAIKLNQMLGNQFAMPKFETHTCFFCGFHGPHEVEHYMADLYSADKQYKCTYCKGIWVYNADEELLDSDGGD